VKDETIKNEGGAGCGCADTAKAEGEATVRA
jgi:hypothetical protein